MRRCVVIEVRSLLEGSWFSRLPASPLCVKMTVWRGTLLGAVDDGAASHTHPHTPHPHPDGGGGAHAAHNP
jgi:hypothetical protein